LTENELSAFAEGKLSAGDLSRAHAHIDECAECRAVVAQLLGGTFDGAASTIPPRGAGSLGTADTLPAEGEAPGSAAGDEPPGPRVPGYRILRRIGRGAMGEVYLAEDEQLDRPVAIKFLSATSEPTARKRFLLEARAVARLRHPNIVTIHSCDITGERPHIVSELLSGQSLDRVPLPLGRDEAVRVAAALARGLSAAHRQGVLHRDLKPANAMRTDEGEIKLLDFGLAKLTSAAAPPDAAADGGLPAGGDAAQRTMTRTGALVGTPLYMAPELWKGRPATPASDVYSLGAMLYELCAGKPARRAISVEALRREIDEPPLPLRQAAPSVDPALAAIVDRCLSAAPEERYPSASELSLALDAIPLRRVPPGRMRRVLAAAGAILALGALAGAAIFRGGAPPAPAAALDPAVSGARRSVAILPFANAAGSEAAWLSTGVAEVLGSCFAAGESLRIVTGAEIGRMLADLDLRGQATFGEEDLRRIRQYAAVDVVVTGSLERAAAGPSLRVRAALRRTDSGAVIATGEAEGTEGAFQDMAALLGERLSPAFGQLPISAQQAARARAVMPASPLAARLHAEGLARLRAGDNEGARERFERAAEAEPASPMPHYWLSVLWASQGQEESERREARLAFEHASGLLREQRLQIEARHYRAHLDSGRALETLRMLHELFPDNVEHGIELASEQPRDEALATLARLHRLPPPAGEDPRIDITEYQVGVVTGDRLEAIRRAAAGARARGARLLLGKARNLEGWGAWDQGDVALAEQAWNDAIAILEPRGHIVDATESMRGLAGIAMLRDDLDGALARYEAAERHLREAGNYASLVFALRNVATVLRAAGAPDKARAKLDEALAVGERSGNRTRLMQTYVSVGTHEHVVGRMSAARAAFERSFALCDELHDARLGRSARGESAPFYAAADELDRAREFLERDIAEKDAEGRRRIPAQLRRQLGRVAIEQGRLDDAAGLLDAALAEAEREAAPIEMALTGAARSLVLAARGDRAAAIAAAEAAHERVARTKNLAARVQVTLDWAHVLAVAGDAAQRARAENALKEALPAIEAASFAFLLHDARLVRCELAAARTSRASARACFAAVADEARKQGFSLVARKAAERAR
jgi:tetratricopeptide (TPR) repeat protein